MISYIKKTFVRDRLIVLLLVLGVVVANCVWVLLESRPPHWDMARHLWHSILYLNIFDSHHFVDLLKQYTYYPPLYYWLTIPFYLFFGISTFVAILINSIFVAILAFSTFGLGRYLWGRKVGLLATVFVLAIPMLASQFKEYQLDAPLTAMVALGMYLLARCEGFSNKKYSILFGAVFGLGMLIKWSFLPIMIIPSIFGAALAIFSLFKNKNFSAIENLVFAFLLAFFIVSPWYLSHIKTIAIDFKANNTIAGVVEGDPQVGSLASNVWYFDRLVSVQLYLVPWVLFLLGLVISVFRFSFIKKNIYPLLLVIGVFVVFSMYSNKDARFTLPMMSGVAILAVFWIELLRNKLKFIIKWLLVAYCVLAFLIVSFGTKLLPQEFSLKLFSWPITAFGQHGYIIGQPSGENWHQEDAFKMLEGKTNVSVSFWKLDDPIWFNNWGLTYLSTRYKIPLVAASQNPTILVVKGEHPEIVPQGYSEIKKFLLPDNTNLRFYQKP